MTMNPDLIHWIADALLVVGIPFIIRLIAEVSELKTDVKWLMRSLDTMGENAAKILHHPDDRYEIDALLEKYYTRNHELTFEEWALLSAKMQAIVDDVTISRQDRILAAMLLMVCDHKTLRPARKITVN